MSLQFWKAGVWVLTRETSSALSDTKPILRWVLAKPREGKSHQGNSCVLLIAACDWDQPLVLPKGQDIAPLLSLIPHSLFTVVAIRISELGSWCLRYLEEVLCQTQQPLCHLLRALQTILKHQIPCSVTCLESQGQAVLHKASYSSSIGGVSSYRPPTALKVSIKKGCLLIYGYLPNSETFPISCAGVKGKANRKQKDKTFLHF